MRTVVLVPWRPGDPHRDRAWPWVRRRWHHRLGLPIVTGDSDPARPFNRSAARNDAARRAGDWDVAVITDADTIVRNAAPTVEAIAQAHATGHVVLPHDAYRALDAKGTALVLANDAAGWAHLARSVARAPLGVVVVPRPAWEQLGGFDERWTGWGGEDAAFVEAAEVLVGLDRLPGEIWHLWHPLDPTKRDYIAAKGGELRTLYRQARRDPDAMRQLLAGARP